MARRWALTSATRGPRGPSGALRRTAAPHTRGQAHWAAAFERAFRFAYLLWVLNAFVIAALIVRVSWVSSGAPSGAGIVIATGALAWSAWSVIRVGPTARTALVTASACVTSQLVSALDTPALALIPGGWWAIQMNVVVGGLLTGSLRRAPAVLALVSWVTSTAAIQFVVLDHPAGGVADILWPAVLTTGLSTMVILALPILRRTAIKADSAVRANLDAETEREGLLAVAKTEKEVTRRLHDEVAHALRASSLPPAAVDQGLVAEQARVALDALDLATTVTTGSRELNRQLADTIARSDIAVTIVGNPPGGIPPAVVTALTGVVAEALRNVGKHAGATGQDISGRHLLEARGREVPRLGPRHVQRLRNAAARAARWARRVAARHRFAPQVAG